MGIWRRVESGEAWRGAGTAVGLSRHFGEDAAEILAPTRPTAISADCLLIGVKQTNVRTLITAVVDPLQKSGCQSCCDAQQRSHVTVRCGNFWPST
jgi:hypothetical protein